MWFKILSTFVGLPPANSMEEDSMILPIGIVPTESCESHFLINEHERHFCVTVILVPLVDSIILSHSVRQMGQNWNGPRSDDSNTRNNFCLWGGALRGDSLCRQKLAINYLPLSTTFRDSLLSQFHKKKVINFVITVKLTRTNRRYRSHFVRHCCRNQKSRRGQGRRKGHHPWLYLLPLDPNFLLVSLNRVDVMNSLSKVHCVPWLFTGTDVWQPAKLF